jgi:hypothetical protein
LIGSTYLVAGLAFFSPSIAVAQEQLSGPRVLFDEAHFSFHTAGGRYKAFAGLLVRDGYRISPSRERFSPPVIAGDFLSTSPTLLDTMRAHP